MMNNAPVAITFALPDESRAFVSRLSNQRIVRQTKRLPLVFGECQGRPVVVIHTGVGDSAECRARLDVALAGHPRPALLICAGYAGALQPGPRVGDLILGENVSDAALASAAMRVLSDRGPLHRGALTTQPRVAETPEAKAALAAGTGAIAVDMETGWIAAASARVGAPILSLRVISDAADQAFPAPGSIMFDQARQRPRYVALPCWLLAHPVRIPAFVRFVRGLGPAQERLAAAIERFLAGLPAMSVSSRV
jgi:adenosylhomocysteine nucleosidase